jgi:hypothetical protein
MKFKNTIFNSRSDEAEERISEVEDRSFELPLSGWGVGNNKKGEGLQDLWNTIKRTNNAHIM